MTTEIYILCCESMRAFASAHSPGDETKQTRHALGMRPPETFRLLLLKEWGYVDTDDCGAWWLTEKGFKLWRKEKRIERLAAEPTGLAPHELGDR